MPAAAAWVPHVGFETCHWVQTFKKCQLSHCTMNGHGDANPQKITKHNISKNDIEYQNNSIAPAPPFGWSMIFVAQLPIHTVCPQQRGTNIHNIVHFSISSCSPCFSENFNDLNPILRGHVCHPILFGFWPSEHFGTRLSIQAGHPQQQHTSHQGRDLTRKYRYDGKKEQGPKSQGKM